MEELKEICDLFLEKIKEKCDPTVYRLWFKDLELHQLDANTCLFGVTNSFKKNIIEMHHKALIEETMGELLGFPVKVSFISIAEKLTAEPASDVSPSSEKNKERLIDIKITNPDIDERYSFENFIVGESNKFVYAAARAVADDPFMTSSYNPLFIHGPSGLGKTHLLFAITNEIKKRNPDVRIIYKRGESFTNEMVSALQKNSMEQFRHHYRQADVLLIDDIQFIAGKTATQEEFFHTFSALYESKKQIILTSDRPPREINPLEDRLRTRFEWGLIADIQPPSEELRTAIIKKKAEDMHIILPDDCISFLTNALQRNIRQIEGSIKKISTLSMLFGKPINLDTCREAVKDFVDERTDISSPITADLIIRIITDFYKVSVEDVKSASRLSNISQARHMCIYLIRTITNMSVTTIGEIFNRNYSTVISSFNKIENDRQTDSTLDTLIQELTNKISKESKA